MKGYIVGYLATLIFGVLATWVSGLFVDDKGNNADYKVIAYIAAIIATALIAGNIAIVFAIIRML